MTYEFLLAAAVAVVSTLFVVTRLNIVHALLYLIVSLLATAVMFLALGAPFLAALEVIVYAGAIMVLFVFTAVMLDLGRHSIDQERAWLGPRVWAGPGALTLALALEFLWITIGPPPAAAASPVALERVAGSLFSAYAAGVELASVLLMAIEIMLNAAGLALVTAGARWGGPDGQVLTIFVLAVAASEVSVGLALVLRLRRLFGTLDTDAAGRLRG